MSAQPKTLKIFDTIQQIARRGLTFWIVLLIIMAYASALRLYALDRVPITFNQDEMVLGYDAWSLWTSGRDHHGQLLPVSFTTYGDYVPPVANYIAAPFVGLLGLNEFSTRLPFALMGIATIGLVALLGRRWFGPAAGLLAALFLAISSWHINFSRIAFPTSLIPFLTVCALYTFTRAVTLLDGPTASRGWRQSGALWVVASGLCFALLTASYQTMKVEAPLLFAACLLACARPLWRHRGMAILWLGATLIFVSPLLIDQITRWNVVGSRFSQVSILGTPEWPLSALRLYTEHYDPSALMFTAFKGDNGNYPPFFGNLFWLDVPLCVVAAVALSRGRRAKIAALSLPILLGVWFLTYPIADSLTVGDSPNSQIVGHPHEGRSYNLELLPELLAGFGAVVVCRKLWTYRYGWLPVAVFGLTTAGLILFFNVRFVPYFFGVGYEVQPATAPYNYGLKEALNTVKQSAAPCDSVWLDSTNQTYMYYLFLTRFPPARFQSIAVLPGASFTAFDQFHAGQPDKAAPAPGLSQECRGQPYRVFDVTRSVFTAQGWATLPNASNTPPGSPWHVIATSAAIPWQTIPAGASPLQATIGTQTALEGYTLKQDKASLKLSLYWRTYSQLPDSDVVFIHIMSGGSLVAQQDGTPAAPPHTWIPGQLLLTTHELALPDNVMPDAIYAGMYSYPSLDRLPVVQNGAVREDSRVLIWSKP